MIEVWKSIKGYEGFYEVSNFGRVRSLPRKTKSNVLKGTVLKPNVTPFGYLQVMLCREGKGKQHKIHRLVANAFIPNPDNLPEINHKDWNTSNNNVDNLEWCDRQYNNAHRSVCQRASC